VKQEIKSSCDNIIDQVVEDNNLPESVIAFGDLKQAYWLGDRKSMTVKVTQDTETALTGTSYKCSIKRMNCWEALKWVISSLALPVMA